MTVFNYENTVYFDIDNTLLMWDENHTQPFDGAVSVVCPHDNRISYHRPHKRHIRFLRKQVAKGMGVVLWSAAGCGWASAAAKALGLDDLDILVVSKPTKCVDDLSNPADILPKIIYLDENGHSE